MSTGWNHKPWDPIAEYARPPARPPLDWMKVALAGVVFLFWTVVIIVVWAQWS